MNVIKGNIVYLNTVSSVSRVVVILLDNKAVFGDTGESNVADLVDLTGFSLDTDAIHGVDDLRISDLNVRNVVTIANRAN
jgi:hypothetical protein